MNSNHWREKKESRFSLSWVKNCWILFAGGFLLGMTYLWIYSQVVDASNTVESFESRLNYLRGRSDSLQSRLSYLQSPAVINRRLEECRIALVTPYPDQIVRVRRKADTPVRESVRARPPQDLVILSIAR